MTETDPRIHENICRITQTINGREWVCIADPHDSAYQKSRQRDARGNWPRSERHYFVRRFPMRGQ